MEVIMEIVETYLKHKGTKKVYLDTITSPERGAHIFTQMFGDNSQECLGIICLDTKGRPTHYSTIYKGTSNHIVISPKDILKVALLSNATSVILGHNHPSTDLTPSPHDIETTRNIRKACTQLDINLVDHLIINSKGEYYSIREHTPKEFSVG
jgi:DNA repair protein RadC